ncbi:MAG: CHRD domain-containing protein [Ignavibacteriaceae bacterium]|nr:CHRD domain-containing protein [Ignavibacteriaceae bacterium]
MYKRLLLLLTAFAAFISVTKAQIVLTAEIEGAQEVPSVTTPALGTAVIAIDPAMKTVNYSITYARLTGNFTASHFHLGAAGSNGGVIYNLTPSYSGNTASGEWTNVPDSIIAKFLKGLVYINIHSSSFPSGEIRGQVQYQPGVHFSASLTGAQEVPSNGSSAKGTAVFMLNPTGDTLHYAVTIAGLTGTYSASHIHNAPAGENGGVVHPVTFTDSTAEGFWPGITVTQLAALLKGDMYLNIHSSAFPGGEIRGQIIQRGQIMLAGDMSGLSEVPANNSVAHGTAYARINPGKDTVWYQATFAKLEGTYTASHFHLAKAGTNGGVVRAVTPGTGNTISGAWTGFADTLLAHMIKGNVYLNVHSSLYTGGEIRGQMVVPDVLMLYGALDNTQETGTVVSSARGTAVVMLDFENGADAEYQITIAGLTSSLTGAHFHNAPAGQNGGVIHAITFTDSTVQGDWPGLSDAHLTELLSGRVYANIHTSNYPSGEIRGQIYLPAPPMVVIPVELASFSAAATGTDVILSWSTASETNNMGFEIERSSDGISYGVIGFVHGKGTSTSLNSYNFTDKNFPANSRYRLKQIDFNGEFSYSNVISVSGVNPDLFSLSQNYPNPFNPSTTINYSVPFASPVKLSVYNTAGELVKELVNEVKDAGVYTATFNSGALASGVYIYRLSAGGFSVTRKMQLMK